MLPPPTGSRLLQALVIISAIITCASNTSRDAPVIKSSAPVTTEAAAASDSPQPCVVQASNELTINRKTALDFDCKQLDFCDDYAGFEAILNLHFQLDEDANGDVDILESNEFLRDNLQYENGAEQRQKGFHVANDKHITVDELWHIWKSSAVHNWSVDQTVDWLANVVELPMYADIFAQNNIDGVALPRLAGNTQYLSQLSINNPIHRQKITLKAMDVVLFGVPKQNTLAYWVAIVLAVIVIVLSCMHFYRKQSYEQEINKMIHRMETVERMEEQFQSMQSELDRTKQENETHSREKKDLELKLKERTSNAAGGDAGGDASTASQQSSGSRQRDHHNETSTLRVLELEQELLASRGELKRMNAAIASSQWPPPIALQQFLQLTFEIELRNYNTKKQAAEQQLLAAREGCDKLKRKRSSLLGPFRMAHGSSLDYVDSTILQARNLLTELTNEMQERNKRWNQIEALCGFEIIRNPGLVKLEQLIYGMNITSTGVHSTAPSPTSSTNSVSVAKALPFGRNGSCSTLVGGYDDDTSSMMSGISSGTYIWPGTIHYGMSGLASKKYSSPTHNLPGVVAEEEELMGGAGGLVFSYDEAANRSVAAQARKRSVELSPTSIELATVAARYRPPTNQANVTFAQQPVSMAAQQKQQVTVSADINNSGSGAGGDVSVVDRPQNIPAGNNGRQRPNLLNLRRGSSDGVEKHFESIARYGSSQSITSQTDSLVNSSAALVGRNGNRFSAITGSKESGGGDSREDVNSNSSSEASGSNTNVNADLSEVGGGGGGGSANSSTSKMSNFFGMRKKKSKPSKAK